MQYSGNTAKSLYQRYQFAVEINGFDYALFQKVKLPDIEFEEVAFAPAGSLFDQKVAGRAKFADLTCEKGIRQDGTDREALDWVQKILDVNASSGGVPEDYMRDVDIVQYNRQGNETRRWTLHGTWVKKLEYGELEGKSNENVIEVLTLCYQYFSES